MERLAQRHLVAERLQALERAEHAVQQRERDVQVKEYVLRRAVELGSGEVANLEAWLVKRVDEVLTCRRTDKEAPDAITPPTSASVSDLMKHLECRAVELEEAFAVVRRCKADVEGRAAALAQKDMELRQRELDLEKREALLDRKVTAINELEERVEERHLAVSRRDDDVTRREADVAQREADVVKGKQLLEDEATSIAAARAAATAEAADQRANLEHLEQWLYRRVLALDELSHRLAQCV